MKHEIKNLLMLMLVGTMLLFCLALPANAATYTYYYENFGTPDTSTANPYSATGEIPYTYAEFGWTAGTAAVDASGRYYINTSTTGADGWANFTFNTSNDYDYFEFRFQYINSWSTWYNHSGLEFRLSGDVGDICFIQVYGANTTVGSSANTIKVIDYANNEVANETITQGQWYTVRLNPDYDTWDDDMDITVYSVTGGTYIVDETVGLNGNTQISKFYMDEAPGSAKVCMLVDNLVLLDTTYTQGEVTTNYLAQYIMPLMYAVAMFVAIVGMAVSGNTSPESLMTLLIVAIVGFVALMIITTI